MAVFHGTDRFEVRRRLGSGSFGVVYEAFDRERGVPVALKLPHGAGAQGLYLFKQEFRALADVIHRNLATLYELLADGDQWFFTMELVDGVPFLDYLRGTPDGMGEPPTLVETRPGEEGTAGGPAEGSAQPEAPVLPSAPSDHGRVRGALRQLAEGLAALHAAGLLHRDLKPSNVLVDRNGRVVILDFGLIVDMEDSDQGESCVELIGTPSYIAPEQVAGHPATAASDWYSVGVLLYQALTGRLPFPASGRTMLAQKLQRDPLAPRFLVPDTPGDLEELCMALLHRNPAARPRGPEVLDRLQARPAHPSGPGPGAQPRPVFLVGREEELAILMEGLRLTRGQRTVVALLHGDSGTGKSSLALMFRREARKRDERTIVLQGRCYEQETVPFKALDSLVDALSQLLKRLPSLETSSLLPRNIQALARLFPVLNQVPLIREMTPEAGNPEPQELRRRAFGALREILRRMAVRGPVALVIDDVQWGDMDSAVLLTELLRPPDPPRVMLVLCYRSEEAGRTPVLRELLPSLAASVTILQDVELRVLSRGEARRLAGMLLGSRAPESAEQAEWIAAESGGSPFFVQELALRSRQSSQEGPGPRNRRLDDYIRLRVEALPEDSRRILQTLAVAGSPLDWEVLQPASGVEARSLASLAGLRAGRLIRMRTGTRRGMLETYHDRIRTAVVASMDEAGVKAANLALACALEARAPRDAQALARHFEAAGILPKASGYAVRAAVQAEAALAFDQAAAFYRKAIQLKEASDPERLSLWKRLGDVLARAGLSAESAEAYLKAAEGGTETSRLRRRAAEEYLRSGNIEAGLAVLTEVLVQAGVRVPGSRTAAVISFLWHRLRLKLRGMDFVERAADQVPAGQLERVDMLWALAMGLGPVDVLRAADFQTRQLLLTLDAGEPFRVARALSHEIVLAAAGGNRSIGKTQALVARSLTLAEHIGDPGPRARALVAEGIARTIQGRWRVSADLLRRAEELLTQHRTGMDYELHLAQHHRLLVLLVLGDLRLIRERLPVLLQEAREKGDLIAATNLRTSISYILSLAKDDPGEARRELEAAIGLWSRRDFHVQHYYHLVSQANIELYAGAALEAFEAMRRAEPGARRSLLLKLQPILVTTLELRARTALALAFDPPRPGAAAALVRSARRDIRRLLAERTTYGGALAMKLRAMLAALSGRDEEALELLLRAELTFEACDMTLHAMAVRHCRGRLTGSAGTGLRESAEAWMKGQGIRNPGRLAAMHVPLPVLFGA